MKKVLAMLMCCVMCAACVSAGAETATATTVKTHLELFSVKVETVDILNTLIQKFEQENPDIEIEQTQVPDAQQVLQTRAAANNLPDIITHYASDPRFKEMAKNGMLMDLSDQDIFSTIKPDMLETTRYDGKLYILPISTNAAGVFYNKKIFEDNGITVPTTYEELIEVCQKLKDAGIVPFEMHNMDWQSGIVGEMTALNTFDDYAAANDAIYSGAKTVRDFPEFTQAAQDMLELNTYAQEDSLGTGYDQALAAFANGETAMLIQGIWIIPSIKSQNPDLAFSSFPLPAKEGKKTRVPYQNDLGLCVSQTCANQEAAVKFLAFMARQENAQYYADQDGSASYVQNVTDSVEESKPILASFDSADSIALWPDQLWQAGDGDTYSSICQQLISDQNMDGYLDSLQDMFSAAH